MTEQSTYRLVEFRIIVAAMLVSCGTMFGENLNVPIERIGWLNEPIERTTNTFTIDKTATEGLDFVDANGVRHFVVELAPGQKFAYYIQYGGEVYDTDTKQTSTSLDGGQTWELTSEESGFEDGGWTYRIFPDDNPTTVGMYIVQAKATNATTTLAVDADLVLKAILSLVVNEDYYTTLTTPVVNVTWGDPYRHITNRKLFYKHNSEHNTLRDYSIFGAVRSEDYDLHHVFEWGEDLSESELDNSWSTSTFVDIPTTQPGLFNATAVFIDDNIETGPDDDPTIGRTSNDTYGTSFTAIGKVYITTVTLTAPPCLAKGSTGTLVANVYPELPLEDEGATITFLWSQSGISNDIRFLVNGESFTYVETTTNSITIIGHDFSYPGLFATTPTVYASYTYPLQGDESQPVDFIATQTLSLSNSSSMTVFLAELSSDLAEDDFEESPGAISSLGEHSSFGGFVLPLDFDGMATLTGDNETLAILENGTTLTFPHVCPASEIPNDVSVIALSTTTFAGSPITLSVEGCGSVSTDVVVFKVKPDDYWDSAPPVNLDGLDLLLTENGPTSPIQGKTLYFAYDENKTSLLQYESPGGRDFHVNPVGSLDIDTHFVFDTNAWVFNENPQTDTNWTSPGTVLDTAITTAGTYPIVGAWLDGHKSPDGEIRPETDDTPSTYARKTAMGKFIAVELSEIDYMGIHTTSTITAHISPFILGGKYHWSTPANSGVRFIVNGIETLSTTTLTSQIVLLAKASSSAPEGTMINVIYETPVDAVGRKAAATDDEKYTIYEIDLDAGRGATMSEEEEDQLPGLIVLCNCDDDNNDGVIDNEDEYITAGTATRPGLADDADDMATFLIRQNSAISFADVDLTLHLIEVTNAPSGLSEGDIIRVYSDSTTNSSLLLGESAGTDNPFYETDPSGIDINHLRSGDLEVWIEGMPGTFAAEIKVEARLTSVKTGDVICTDVIQIKVSPIALIGHHMPPVRSFVSELSGHPTWPDNTSSVLYCQSEFPTATPIVNDHAISHPLNNHDPWAQDEFQIGYQSAPYKNMYVALDSPRDGGINLFARASDQDTTPGLLGVDFGHYDMPGAGDTYDSFGNLEVTPPCVIDGSTYPLGLVYFGDAIDSQIKSFFSRQKIQKPIGRDVISFNASWLQVGHVDEFMSIIPVDPATTTSVHGWKVLLASPELAVDICSSNTTIPIPKYSHYNYTGHSISTIGDLLAHPTSETASISIVDYNLNVIQPHIDDLRASLASMDGFNLPSEDIIDVPVLFKSCDFITIPPPKRGLAESITPDLVNGAVYPTVYIAPEQFLGTSDPFEYYLTTVLSGSGIIAIEYIDDWDIYHTNMGEVHCSSNEIRSIPSINWWDFPQFN